MRYSKPEKIAYIKAEIRKAEQHLIEHHNMSKEMKDYYNERIDMLQDILTEME